MKRTGNLFDQLVSWPNLLFAARRARRGKRFRPNVARFEFFAEYELLRLQQELIEQRYVPGPFRTFVIHEPKRRTISAAPYRDRVVHHALCNVIEPIFERSFIGDSYACRRGKGTHAAARRAQQFAKQFDYVLQADVRKFSPSVDHVTLLGLVSRKIKDPRVMWLVRRIVEHDGSPEQLSDWFPGDDLFTPLERRRGLPIGNQTSQFLANVMLNPLDHFVKEQLRSAAYVRYADDVLVFGDDKMWLAEARTQIRSLLGSLRLKLHPRKSEIYPVSQGVPFLGYRIFRTHTRLDSRYVYRVRRRLRRMQLDYARGRIDAKQVRIRLVSWMGHARHANSRRLIQKLLREHPFSRPRVRGNMKTGPGAE
jgi:retron-type reverse transcriptase